MRIYVDMYAQILYVFLFSLALLHRTQRTHRKHKIAAKSNNAKKNFQRGGSFCHLFLIFCNHVNHVSEYTMCMWTS